MTIQEAANHLTNGHYRDEMTKEMETLLRDNGLVAVFGASDDLLEFRGAISEELGAWKGTSAYIVQDKKDRWCAVEKEDYLQNQLDYKETYGKIPPLVWSIWCPTIIDSSWLIESDLPLAEFKIFDDEDLYCVGIVFSINDLLNA